MLDFRHETFLVLCKIGHYTKTAEYLHITQPAVSQHMKFLEEMYGGRLFYYEGRVLKLTERGLRLQEFVSSVSADSAYIQEALVHANQSNQTISFGATLSIGEYVMPEIMTGLMLENPELELHMQVGNTKTLLSKLHDGVISFAFIEGFFDKAAYGWSLFSEEEFIPVCSPHSDLVESCLSLKDLLDQRLILRENGSGTRDILEHILYEQNLSIQSFRAVCEVGNMKAIKELVGNDLGITFLYQAAAQSELETGRLAQLKLKEPRVFRAFHFVYLKNSRHEQEYLKWFECFAAARSDNKKTM